MSKKTFVVFFVMFSIYGDAQDTSTVAPPSAPKIISHEFGGNFTLLLKQVFNLSNNTFPTLPYDVTYKRISNTHAFRSGLGITMNNSNIKSVETNTNQGFPPPGPDPIVPTTNNSMNLYLRAGWEKRYELDKRFLAYWGVDLIGQYGYNNSKSCIVNNSLPSSYSYIRTTDNITTVAFGAGPVAGIQFFFTKRLSVLTEIPLYFVYSDNIEITDFYQNQYSSFNGNYTSSDDKQNTTTTGTKLTLTLPVTLYLCLKF